MDTKQILLLIPLLIIFSYLFDAFSRKTKFPSVLLLLGTGIIARAFADWSGFSGSKILDELIAVLGTIGLILIVLEGALELQIKKENLGLLLKGFIAALVVLLLNIALVSQLIEALTGLNDHLSVLLAVPLSIISSAVAIPSATGLLEQDKEFVVFESTFSDILGILIFNYALGQYQKEEALLASTPLINLGIQLIGIVALSLVIAFLLFQLLQRITHHVKFFLILALLILLYAIGKYMHLPALVTIFIFGLFLGNVSTFFPRILAQYLDPEKTKSELHEFHILTGESTFLVRTFFFLFFGFSITLDNFLSPDPYFYGLLILGVMFMARYAFFSVSEFKLQPSTKVFLSPRGLISILLFFQLQDSNIPGLDNQPINEKVLLIVIIFSMLIMIVGTLRKTSPELEEEAEEAEEAVAFSITNPEATIESNKESLNETDVPTPEE